MKKRGALELSVTTIVIVVIGVALLTLALVFVKGIFGKLTGLSDEIFGKSSTIIDTLSIDAKISCPSTIKVEQGKTTTFKCLVGHDGKSFTGSRDFDIKLTPKFPPGITEEKVRAKIISEHPVKLNEGEQATFVIQVATTANAPLSAGLGRTASYSLTVTSNNQVYETIAFIINIEKGRGVF